MRLAQRAFQNMPSRLLAQTQSRGIKLHEYQAGALLDKYKVAIPLGTVAKTPEEAYQIASKFENGCVVKS